MKFVSFSFAFFLSFNLLAKESFNIPFKNGNLELQANIEKDQGTFYVDDVRLSVPGESHGKLHLVAEFGWGDEPYNYLCEYLSQEIYDTDEYKYASAYGYLTSFGVLSIFTNNDFLIIKRGQEFTISEDYPNSSYDSGFACYNTDIEY
ncbi:MAG: hypothetical protein HRT44_04605 [Bdellovibrionales bacterium]|nr:hypothetical protein [Bdellovibrionales bacterium]NQZ18524.1 hypothetical protein [Bdellovibrionales bacterium]